MPGNGITYILGQRLGLQYHRRYTLRPATALSRLTAATVSKVMGPTWLVSNTIAATPYSNGTTPSNLGIDLGPDGVTPNTPRTPTVVNNLQNFPVITSALVTGSTKTIKTLNSTGRDVLALRLLCELFWKPAEKERLISAALTTDQTDANGDVSIFHPDVTHAPE